MTVKITQNKIREFISETGKLKNRNVKEYLFCILLCIQKKRRNFSEI